MSQITINEQTGDFTHVVKLTYADLANIGDGNQDTIAKIPAGGAVELVGVYAVELVGVYESVALAGASDITFDIGTTAGDPDEFIDALDVDGMSAPVFNTGDAFTTGYTEAVGGTNSAADVLLEVNGTVGDLTAGEVVIGIRMIDLGRFA